MNIAANKDLLLVNYQNFNSVKGFLFCGFQQHINSKTKKCEANVPGFYQLDLPHQQLNRRGSSQKINDFEQPEANYKLSFHNQELYSCKMGPDELFKLPSIPRSKLQFICGYMSTYRKWRRTDIKQMQAVVQFNQFIFSLFVVSMSCVCAVCSIGIMRWKQEQSSTDSLRY